MTATALRSTGAVAPPSRLPPHQLRAASVLGLRLEAKGLSGLGGSDAPLFSPRNLGTLNPVLRTQAADAPADSASLAPPVAKVSSLLPLLFWVIFPAAGSLHLSIHPGALLTCLECTGQFILCTCLERTGQFILAEGPLSSGTGTPRRVSRFLPEAEAGFRPWTFKTSRVPSRDA